MQMKIRIVRKGLDISQQNVWRTAIQNLPNISRSSKHRTNYIYEIMKHNMCLIDISINFTFLLFNWLLSILWVVGAVKLTHQKWAPTTQNTPSPPPPEPPLPPSSQWAGQPGAPSERCLPITLRVMSTVEWVGGQIHKDPQPQLTWSGIEQLALLLLIWY